MSCTFYSGLRRAAKLGLLGHRSSFGGFLSSASASDDLSVLMGRHQTSFTKVIVSHLKGDMQ